MAGPVSAGPQLERDTNPNPWRAIIAGLERPTKMWIIGGYNDDLSGWWWLLTFTTVSWERCIWNVGVLAS